MKAAVLAALIAVGLVAQVGAANTAVFYVRSLQLEQAWLTAEAEGVPGAALAPSRAALRALDLRWAGALPYAAVSGAALDDAFAAQAGISSDPAWQTSAEAQIYLSRPYPGQLEQHATVMARLSAAISTVGQRVNARQTAEADLAKIPRLLPQALRYGIGVEYS